ncbi:MAG: Hsp20/alpha crystallin family protein [Chloroflexi bacterium]|nr:Hsp20/alpha crystallin family protein [Chloroflexota bacterium]
MRLVSWEPSRELARARETMDRIFEDVFLPSRLWAPPSEELALDIYQTDNTFVVKASLPGVKPDEVDVHVTGNTLNIKGERREEKEVKEADYLRKELRYGHFSRSLELPAQIRADKAEAVFENGLLTLTLPLAVEEKVKKIAVKPVKVIEAGKKEAAKK